MSGNTLERFNYPKLANRIRILNFKEKSQLEEYEFDCLTAFETALDVIQAFESGNRKFPQLFDLDELKVRFRDSYKTIDSVYKATELYKKEQKKK